MKKGRVILLLLVMGAFAASAVWAQKNSPPRVVSGTIARVDVGAKEFVVQNDAGKMIRFTWEKGTKVNGPGSEALSFEDLKGGMQVTVFYLEKEQKRMASRVDVRNKGLKALKGITFPFECGPEVC